MRYRLALVATMAMVLATLPAAPAVAQAPDNDDFGNAAEVMALPYQETVDVTEATTEADEPLETCAPFANTVWYALTLAEPIDVVVDTAGSDYDTAVAVWTGEELFDLALVACVDDVFGSLQSAVRFSAAAGVTYFVQIGAFGELIEGGTLQVSIEEAGKTTGKPFIQKASFRGNSASASTSSFDPETGTSSYTDVFVNDGRVKTFKERPYRSGEMYFSHYEESFNEETGQYTFTELFGFAQLEPGEFTIAKNLQSASLDTVVTVSGYTCTEGPYEENGNGYEYETVCTELGPDDLAVVLAWEGFGPLYRSMYTDRSSSDGFRSSFRATSTSRQADVMGAATGELGVFDFTGGFGNLSKETNADMSVVRANTFFFMI